jgi:Cd2+/Zn2+-exporting ATPase
MLTLLFSKPKLLFDTLAIIGSFILMIVASFVSATLAPWFWGAAFIIGGYSKAIEGISKTIEEKSLNVEFLMIAAAIAAFTTDNYSEGAILIFIFAVSGVMEEFATAQSEKALTNLLKLAPKTAILFNDRIERVIESSFLKIGDIILVKPGQLIPADGTIVLGGASIDQSAITGEFTPQMKLVDEAVFAGSLCIDSTIEVRVNKNPSETLVQKMIELVKKAQEEKTLSEQRVTTFEKIYVYVVIAFALSVMFVTPVLGWLDAEEAFRRGVIVLVVASPCALVASITPALLSTLSHAARKGILIKSGRHLETFNTIKVVAFDKTGTITTGKPQVKKMIIKSGFDETVFLNVVVNAERSSNHPLAKAIANRYQSIQRLSLSIKEIPGRGLEVTHQSQVWQIGRFDYRVDAHLELTLNQCKKDGYTIVPVNVDKELVGFITLQDTIREEAKLAIKQLKALGIETVMLTGDNQETARNISFVIGINSYQGNCFPEDKVKAVQRYKDLHKPILMIGDGINDAPALALADLGVSMGDATDVSLETSDVVMMNNNLANIPYMMGVTKKMKTIISQNVVFSIAVISLLLLSNVFGLIVLQLGVLGHELSTILVILNSLRLLRIKS